MPYCPECGSEIDENTNFCPECGTSIPEGDTAAEDQNEEVRSKSETKPWYDKGFWIAFWIFVFFPVGIYALYRTQRMSPTLKKIILGLLIGAVGAFFLDRLIDWTAESPSSPSVAMLSIFWVLALLSSAGAFIIGMVNPSWVMPWVQEPSRSRVAKMSGYTFLVLLVFGPGLIAVSQEMVKDRWTAEKYKESKKDILVTVDSLIEAGNPEVALDTVQVYSSDFADQPVLDSLRGVAQADTLYQSVLQIPASELEKNIEMYERLAELDPGRELFQKKLERYRKLKKQRDKRSEAKQEAKQRRQQLASGAWVACQTFVERRLRSPSTASYPWGYSDYTSHVSGTRYRINAYVDAENALGAEVRSDFVCVVEYDGNDKSWSLISMDIQSR